MMHCTLNVLRQLLLRQFIIVFCHTHCGVLVLLLILVTMVLCNVVLQSNYLMQYFALHIVAYWYCCRSLLLWYYALLHCILSVLKQYIAIHIMVYLVLLLILVLVVLCNVALYSGCFKQCFVIHLVAYWYFCWFFLFWCYVMLYCTLSV